MHSGRKGTCPRAAHIISCRMEGERVARTRSGEAEMNPIRHRDTAALEWPIFSWSHQTNKVSAKGDPRITDPRTYSSADFMPDPPRWKGAFASFRDGWGQAIVSPL